MNPHLIEIGSRVHIFHHARLEALPTGSDGQPKLRIGDGTAIQYHFHCGAALSVSIGRDVLIGGRVFITDHDHSFADPAVPPIRDRRLLCAPVVIGDGAWLGEGCTVLKGVTIGERAVVAAGAVVTKDVPPWSVAAGVPARVISRYGPPSVHGVRGGRAEAGVTR